MNTATKKKQLTVILICFILFLTISVLSSNNHLRSIDQRMYGLLNIDHSSFLYSMMDGLATIGSGEIILLLTGLIALFLLMNKLWMHLAFLLTVVFGGIAINFLLKLLFQRERPGETQVLEVFGYSLEMNSYSFPSGHTMRTVILFSFLIFLCISFLGKRQLRAICTGIFIAIPLLIALSRVMTGAHYFTDISAAVFISVVWFLLCYIIFQNSNRVKQKKSHPLT